MGSSPNARGEGDRSAGAADGEHLSSIRFPSNRKHSLGVCQDGQEAGGAGNGTDSAAIGADLERM